MVINRAVFHDKFGDESYTSRIPSKSAADDKAPF